MRIHAMLLVRDEADILWETLPAAAEWCDGVYVLDNGSTDGTWELVRDLAAREPRIVPVRVDRRPFHQSLRRQLFEAFRGDAGDWWCKLDADELYIDDPRAFLPEVEPRCGEVWSASFEYYFTDRDVARWEEDPTRYGPRVPVASRCRYYLLNHSEPRFFRDSERLDWSEGDWPENLGPRSARRIRLKHFQYRSPEQIQRRLDTRRAAMANRAFLHEMLPDWRRAILEPRSIDFRQSSLEHAPRSWRDRVVDAALLVEDTGGPYPVDEASLPSLPRVRPEWERRLRARLRPLKARLTG